MSLPSTRSKITASSFFAALIVACFGLYHFIKGPTIQADEVRIYQLLSLDKPSPHPFIQLRGNAAQSAASNFVFHSNEPFYECLDGRAWFRVVFVDKQHNHIQTFSVYLPNGQTQALDDRGTVHLTESSRLYWEKLIRSAH